MSDLLSEVSWDILLRLPAESLFRFRSVCKAWRRIIDDPSFVKAHTHNQLHSNTLLLGDETGNTLYSFSLDSFNYINGPQTIHATPIKPFVREGLLQLPDLAVVASCNGLLLLSHQQTRHCSNIWAIWNPLTNDCHKLPKPDVAPNLYGCGFGYDSDSDDYKVVRIDDVGSGGVIDLQTRVYSLKSDSWRMIEHYPYDIHVFHVETGVFLDGKLYWLVEDELVELDLMTERYSKFPSPPLPYGSEYKYRSRCTLNAFCGSLICSVNIFRRNELHGLMMKDDGMDKSWIELFKLSYPSFMDDSWEYLSKFSYPSCVLPWAVRVVAYLENKRQVLLFHEVGGFLWFDLENNSRKDFCIDEICRTSITQICPGSLVRLSNLGFGPSATTSRRNNIGFGAVASATTSRRRKKRKAKRKHTRLTFHVYESEIY